MNLRTPYILLLCAIFMLPLSCTPPQPKEEKEEVSTSLIKTELPPVSDLMIQVSNPDADTVLLCSPGGPSPVTDTTAFSFFLDIPTLSTVYVKKYEEVHSGVLADTALTFKQGIQIDETSAAYFRKVFEHFKQEGKVIVLIGHSFGAFLLEEYLDDYGNEDIQSVIPLSGRLDMDNVIWISFLKNHFASFKINGQTPVVDPNEANSKYWAGMVEMSSMGYNRFTDSLAGMNLQNMLYIYAKNDEQVGRLKEHEIEFLTESNATVIGVHGGHSTTIDSVNLAKALNFIRR